MPPSILLESRSIDEAIKSANKQVLIVICVAMRVPREGSEKILMENLKPKMQDIQDWVNVYQHVVAHKPTQDQYWTTILGRTFKRKDREKGD
jgi:hypothetical protein